MLVVFLASNAVYADQVDVPFDYKQRYCNENDDGSYTCTWDPFGEVITELFIGGSGDPLPEVIEDVTTCPNDLWELQEDGITCLPKVSVAVIPEVVKLDEPKNQFEEDLLYFETVKPPTTNAEKEYFALLQNLATCQRGSGEASLIQPYERFAVSTTWVNTDEAYLKSLDYRGTFRILKAAVEECRAQWTILQPIILGPRYANIARDQEAWPGFYHADLAKKVPPVSQERVNNEANNNEFRTLDDAQRTLCRHDLYPQNIKESYEYCDLYKIPVIVNAVIEYESIAWHKYMEYKNFKQSINESVRGSGAAPGNPISKFISQYGGYESAIDAIKWRQHYDSTDPVELDKPWNE